MQFLIDTGSVGMCPAADLRSVLEKARDHFFAAQADAAAIPAAAAAGPGPDPKADMPGAMKHAQTVQAAGAPLKAAYLEKATDIAKHVNAAIDSACKLAAGIGGTVTCTIVGHEDSNHISRCPVRISVSVDQVG